MALARIAVALAGLVALALAITLLEAAPDLLREGGAGRVARFAALRAALLADELAAVAILSGAALTFATLAARSEMVALRAAGMSAARLMLRLAPLALALAGAGY
ncbi:MAG: LPS export ABC transporter permease LptG, partial [Rhodobacterales bacterium CG_4_9_14_3_um_filter_71_31]